MQIYEEWKALPAEEKAKYEDYFSYSAFSFAGSAFHFSSKSVAICMTDGLGILSFSACKVDQINYCQAMCTMLDLLYSHRQDPPINERLECVTVQLSGSRELR